MNWEPIINKNLATQLEQILENAHADFTANLEGGFLQKDIEEIISRSHKKLYNVLTTRPINTSDELAKAWNQIVTDFYQNNYWGYPLQTKAEKIVSPSNPGSQLASYLRVFLVPTLLLKGFLLYFGLNYSNNPGEGYGWGLIIAIVLSLLNFAFFIWKTRNNTEE